MIKCMNSDCINYKLTLEDNIEECPACGKPTTKTGANVKNNLALGAMGMGAVALIIYWFGFGFGDLGFGQIAGFVLSVGSIVLGFISRSKLAVILTIGFLAFMVGYIAIWAI